ncbi:MAG: NAD(P)H-dependent oxidoreductase [Gammaproteobacteria bacterium]|nr:NAD(P)H-dependent oxidoreductase [Gammaproteobacteria bacterium]
MASRKLLFLAGSSRTASLNKQLAKQASEIAVELGAHATFIDLADFEMPIYNGDLEAEQSLPANAIRLKELFYSHDGLFIASPEYNSSIPPLLKNTLDWVSRVHTEQEAPLSAYSGKVAALVAASPGSFGGVRVLAHLRTMLSSIGVTVVASQLTVAAAHKKIEAGRYVDEGTLTRLRNVVKALINTTVHS